MSTTINHPKNLAVIAAEHGVDLTAVRPLALPDRLRNLRLILDQHDVPYPIPAKVAETYYTLAASGAPFGIGTLSGLMVDLQEYRNQQVYEKLTLDDHLSWACLVADQAATKHSYACREYLLGEEMFEIGGVTIPDYYILNARIYQQTGWQLATVNKIIPANVFFHCHSRKFFPVTTFMRPLGTDYLEEPDIGHDVAGHVATFTIPQVALVMNNHGLANDLIRAEMERKLEAVTDDTEKLRIRDEANELLLYAGRLYWFTVEFGLVLQQEQLRVFGAGILSSPGETRFSVDSPLSNRVLIDPRKDRDLLRLATTDYLISEYQKTYFVMKEFNSLTSLTPDRILRIVQTAKKLPHHTWTELVPGDEVFNVGHSFTSSVEKYSRLSAGQPLDECQRRTAVRNLRRYKEGIDVSSDELAESFMKSLPPLPKEHLVLG
jgi:phenylalanine-4-hydroxylase